MIRIILSGCNGKMGQVVTRICANDPSVKIVAGCDLYDKQLSDYPVYKSFDLIKEEGDLAVDFSNPNALEGLLAYCTSKKIPVVVATTGLNDKQKDMLKEASSVIPVFYSANMSLGINLLIELVKKTAVILEDQFDIEIIEKHHNQKIDAPSGTALAIADAINQAVKTPKNYTYDRHAVRKKRDKAEIGIHAVRGGTIVGEHSILFAGLDEVIEFRHQANSKEIFAAGAMKAVKFLADKPAGMYSMSDIFVV
jgi:4-hydroxy-tetrahydrodipicolinate reductase